MAFLINKYIPDYTYNEYHERLINASAKKCFLTAKNLDMSKSILTMTLLKLRGIPIRDLHLQEFIKTICFTYLEENLYKEFVIDASQRKLKIIWNFNFIEITEK